MFKRFFAFLLILILLPTSSALANWGLEGELLELVARAGEWMEYDPIGPQTGNFATLGTSEHNAVIHAEDGNLKVYTGVLLQPNGADLPWPMISAIDGMFLVIYGEDLWYTFQEIDNRYILVEGLIYGLTVERIEGDYGYNITDETGDTAILPGLLFVDEFSIDLFPRTLDEVRHLNRLHATLGDGRFLMNSFGSLLMYAEDLSKASVYTAPYADNAFRVRVNGKNATVSFRDDVWVLREWNSEHGGDYYLIRYNVNPGKQRIGFIRRAHVDGTGVEPWPETEVLDARVVTTRKTVLTDDPNVSHSKVMQLAEGARLECMGIYDGNHAYVGTVDRNGRHVWGFVPLRDLAMLSWELYDHETELMEQMEGVWWFQSGPDKLADLLTLHADGTYEGFGFLSAGEAVCSGEWFITRYDPAAGLYVDDPMYEITFLDESGRVWVDGVTVEDNTFMTHGHEETGFYMRVNQGE